MTNPDALTSLTALVEVAQPKLVAAYENLDFPISLRLAAQKADASLQRLKLEVMSLSSPPEIKEIFDRARGDFANVHPPKVTDNRHCYSAGCSWNGPIAKVGSSGGLPACPHCGSMLFETSADKWRQDLGRYAESSNDEKYPAFMDWLSTRGTCSALRNDADLKALRVEFDALPPTT